MTGTCIVLCAAMPLGIYIYIYIFCHGAATCEVHVMRAGAGKDGTDGSGTYIRLTLRGCVLEYVGSFASCFLLFNSRQYYWAVFLFSFAARDGSPPRGLAWEESVCCRQAWVT